MLVTNKNPQVYKEHVIYFIEFSFGGGVTIIEILCSSISWDNVYLVCVETVKAKTTRNDSGVITYQITIYFAYIWLDNIGYIITQWQNFAKNRLSHGSKFWEEKKVPKVGKICAKDEILTVQEKQIAYIKNKTKLSLKINPYQRELEAQRLKESNMRTKKRIGEKILSDIGGE